MISSGIYKTTYRPPWLARETLPYSSGWRHRACSYLLAHPQNPLHPSTT